MVLGLIVSETLLGRWLPWVAASLTALIIGAVLWYVIWQACLGHRTAAALSRAEMLAWVFFAWLLSTTVLGANAVYGDEPLRRVLALALAFYVAHDNFGGPSARRSLMQLLMGAATVVALTGLIGWPIPPDADGRLRSSLDNPSLVGALMCLTLPLWPASTQLQRHWCVTAVRAAAATLCVVALVLAESRLAMLAVALALIGHFALRPRPVRATWRSMGPVAMLLALSLVGAGLLWGLQGHESSASHRVFIWQTCLRMLSIPRVAVLGSGVGSFPDGFRMSRPWVGTDRSDTLAVVDDAHNDILHIACESGLPGGAMFLWLVVCAVGPLLRLDATAGGSLAGLRLALAAWSVNGLANTSVDALGVALPAFMLLGAVIGDGARQPDRTSGPPATAFRRAVSPLVACLLVLPWVGQQTAARVGDLLWLRSAELSGGERVEALSASVNLYPRPERVIQLAVAVEPERARSILADAARAWPWNAEIRYQMCRQFAAEDPQLALQWAREAVRLDPYNPYYLRQLAAIEASLGDRAAATDDLSVALELYTRTLEVAEARHGPASPACEALRAEIREARAALAALEAQ